MNGRNQPNEQLPDQITGQPKYACDLPDGCPPHGAVEADGTFYATHLANPPDQNDFRTAAERNVFKGKDECMRRGNSVMASLKDARHLCRAYPAVHSYVSEGFLKPEHGMLLHNGSNSRPSHHTLWRYSSVAMHDIFRTVI